MGQSWYIQYEDRTVGPLSSRQLHALPRIGELKPDDRVSLDGQKWFRAAKVIGLFPEATAGPDPGDDDLAIETVEGPPATRILEPGPGLGPEGALLATRGDTEGSRSPGDDPAKTRVETFAGSIVGEDRPAPPPGRAGALARWVGFALLKLAWWTIRGISIAVILVVAWSVRVAIGLIRRRKVGPTSLESRLWAILRGRPAGSGGSVALPAMKRLPERFGRYQVIRELGRGGMGAVYLATDTQLGRQVALKVPHFTPEDGPEVLERFDREARAAALLNHPNVCPIFDVGAIDGIPYVSMAYVEGRPLADLVDTDLRLSEYEAAMLVRKVALAMAEAHHKGIIHRDLKPANIMIDARREPVIMDFGLARRSGVKDSKISKAGSIIGTPAYMSPEQIGGDPAEVGPSCDIYSLGVVLYELLTGRLPFEGPVMAVLGQILSSDPKPPSVHRPDVDHQLEAICRKAMARSAGDRFATMADFARSLTKYLKAHPDGEGVEDNEGIISWSDFFALPPRPAEGAATSPPADGGRWLLRAVAASVVLLAGSVGYLAWRDGWLPGDPKAVAPSASGPTINQTTINQSTVIQTVNVTLANYQVIQATVNVTYVYYLDGKPIDVADLSKPLPLAAGEHAVEARGPDGRAQQSWTFAVSPGDDRKTVNVRRPPSDAPEDVKTQVELLLDEDAGVRKLAAEQLGVLNNRAAVPALINRVADNLWFDSGYTNVPSDPVAGGKDAALNALRKLAPERVADALIRASRSTTADVRLWSLENLAGDRANAGKPEAVEAVIAMLKDPDSMESPALKRAIDGRHIRRVAAECLGSWGVAAAVPALVDRVSDDLWYGHNYSNVPTDPVGGGKAAAVDALRKLAPERVTPALIRASRSPDARIRLWSLETLAADDANARDPEAVKAVIAMLKDQETDRDGEADRAKGERHIRRVAANCLRTWGATAAVPALVERVADDVWYDSGFTNIPDDPVAGGKAAALEALRKLAPDQVAPALRRALKSPKAEIRKWALGELGPKT